MAEITRKLDANTRSQFFVITNIKSIRCLVENFQLICSNDTAERLDGCSGETLLNACAR